MLNKYIIKWGDSLKKHHSGQMWVTHTQTHTRLLPEHVAPRSLSDRKENSSLDPAHLFSILRLRAAAVGRLPSPPVTPHSHHPTACCLHQEPQPTLQWQRQASLASCRRPQPQRRHLQARWGAYFSLSSAVSLKFSPPTSHPVSPSRLRAS